MIFFKFYTGLFVLKSVNANFEDMGCTWNVGHDFFNVAWQTVDVRKTGKIVMKSEIVSNTTYKTHTNKIRIFDHEKKSD